MALVLLPSLAGAGGYLAVTVRVAFSPPPNDDSQGILVVRVTPGGPADKDGLKAGDVIQKIDGREVKTLGLFRDTIADKAGKTITLHILRKGKERKLKVQVLDTGKGGKVK